MDEQQGVTDTAKVDPKLEKIRKFGEDPDKFICLDDLIVGAIKTERGIAIYLGENSRIDFEIVQSRINYKLAEAYRYMDMEAAKEKSKSEIKVVGSHNGAPLFGRR
jgi:hypothetical protein